LRKNNYISELEISKKGVLNAPELEKIAFKVKLINYQENNQNSAG
jgi:hypothetical protein